MRDWVKDQYVKEQLQKDEGTKICLSCGGLGGTYDPTDETGESAVDCKICNGTGLRNEG